MKGLSSCGMAAGVSRPIAPNTAHLMASHKISFCALPRVHRTRPQEDGGNFFHATDTKIAAGYDTHIDREADKLCTRVRGV